MNTKELENLYELKEKGVISDEEFELKKKQILSEPQNPQSANKKAVVTLLVVAALVLVGFVVYQLSPKTYEAGQVKCVRGICYDGQKEITGKVVSYYPDKQLKTVRKYKKGVFSGEETGYYENGEVRYVYEPEIHKDFYENGQLKFETEYADSQVTREKFYSENGKLKTDKTFDDGFLTSVTEYYESEKIALKKTIDKGSSFEEKFDENGALVYQLKMENNIPVEQKSFYDNGFIEVHSVTSLEEKKVTVPVNQAGDKMKSTATMDVRGGTINSFHYNRDGNLERICVVDVFSSQRACYPFKSK